MSNDSERVERDVETIGLLRGDIALCGSGVQQFGKVQFALSCDVAVRDDFNLATALLHSFEYTEAEKVFAKVIDKDPSCVMAYWGVAMSNFHPLWAPPTKEELEKGSNAIALARSIGGKSKKESAYLDAVGALYDDWATVSHFPRLLRFEKAAEKIFRKYPEDKEAAIFYALALRAASDPSDKVFDKQRRAGAILESLFPGEPDHPGIAHYLIHTYDYPELAELALPAARRYASIAASSAHALHMPSHIFTRLGLWEESIESNINSMSAAKCYAENLGMKGHWDEELHGLDYLVYAYLQQGRTAMAKEQLAYLNSIEVVFPMSNKNAYTFAAVPARYALETRDWKSAAKLEMKPSSYPWEEFPWERSIFSFARLLGAVHVNDISLAKAELERLRENHASLLAKKRDYEATQVQIQVTAGAAWIALAQEKRADALRLMNEAASMEDATEKHPVTPGEIVPARELLGDMYMASGEYQAALEAYEDDLKRHPGRFNGLYGAALAAEKCGVTKRAVTHYRELLSRAAPEGEVRPELARAEAFVKRGL
jgi:Tfp pilus assembly protein PilF